MLVEDQASKFVRSTLKGMADCRMFHGRDQSGDCVRFCRTSINLSRTGSMYDTHMLRVHSRKDDRISARGTKNHETIQKLDARDRCIYAKDMSPDQAWLFYAFHSDLHLAFPHEAFWKNASKPDAQTRWSIKVRVWVFFEGDAERS